MNEPHISGSVEDNVILLSPRDFRKVAALPLAIRFPGTWRPGRIFCLTRIILVNIIDSQLFLSFGVTIQLLGNKISTEIVF